MKNYIIHILKKIYFLPGLILNAPNFILNNIKIPSELECIGRIYIKNKGKITLGKNVRIRSGIYTNPIGCGVKTILRTFKNGRIEIGNHVKMSNVCICSAKKVIIEDEVMIGGGVCIYDTDFHSMNPFIRMELVPIAEKPQTSDIKIGYGSFIGAGTTILKGSNIGTFSVIGARSVVCGKIPSYEVWGGNPAKFIRKLTKEEIQK